MRSLEKQAGFTLVELLVVIAIIGLLTGIVTVSLAPARIKARDDQRRANLASIATALENYHSQKKEYPPKAAWTSLQELESTLVPAYTDKIPVDPKFSAPYTFETGGYVYATNAATIDGQARRNGLYFALDATLERDTVTEPLDSTIEPLDSSKGTFFRTGYYRYPSSNGKIHYRIGSR